MVNQGNRPPRSGGPNSHQGDVKSTGRPDRRPPSAGMPGPGGRGRGTRIEKAKDAQGTVRRLLAYLVQNQTRISRKRYNCGYENTHIRP
jgi:hypothetical protein